ncbi:AraC family transcriptional regulator ligand-binding domain-containing protein [Cereibacter sphaeroides f. sp. denitrificans]
MYDKHPIRLSIVHMVPDVAESRNLVLAPLLAGVGLDLADLTDRTQIVLRAQVVALLRLMARQAGEATLGVDLADAARPSRLGPSGEALLGGRTLRECIEAHIRHLPNLQAGVRVGLQVSGSHAHWRHAFVNGDPEQAAVLTEGIAAFFVKALRAITGQPDLPVYLVLPHRQHAPMRQYEEKLRCAVSFRPGRETLISFDSFWLDWPNQTLTPDLRSPDRVDPVGRDAAVLADDAALRKSLQLIFGVAAMSGRLSLVDSARTLGIAPRSLQRRLAGMDSSFEAMVDDWRRERALQLIAHGQPLHEISARLGYTHQAHFTRAFGRWQGMAPSRYRAALGSERT